MNYVKNKGVLVGTFNAQDLKDGTDKIKTKEMMNQTGYKYTNTELIKKGKNIIGLRIWVCNADDFRI